MSVVACGDTTEPESVASVAVTPASATLVSLGETAQLTASAQDANGTAVSGKTFTWSSSDQTIATVNSSGLVTAVVNGAATITATVDGVNGTASILVQQAATTIAVNDGDNQSAFLNTAVSTPPAVIVTDANANPVSGVDVTFTVASGGATVDPVTAVTTDANGIAAVNSWTLGGTAGANTLDASATGLTTVTFNATAVQVQLRLGAAIAGNVADADGNGLGDNHNDLPGGAPVFVAAGVDVSGGPGSNGTIRVHIEWGLAPLGLCTVRVAQVELRTSKGTVDQLDTQFFALSADGDGLLGDADFESPGLPIPGALMPVPPVPFGTEGMFVFEVTGELRAAIESGLSFFSMQGRVDESLSGTGFKRGLQVRSTASLNLVNDLVPKLAVACS